MMKGPIDTYYLKWTHCSGYHDGNLWNTKATIAKLTMTVKFNCGISLWTPTWIDLGRGWTSISLNLTTSSFLLQPPWLLATGPRIFFWEDRWLDGHAVKESAPAIYRLAPKRRHKCHGVAEALHEHAWGRDLQGADRPRPIHLPLACRWPRAANQGARPPHLELD